MKTKVFQLPAHKGYRQADGRTSPKNRKSQKFRQTQRKPKKAPSFPARIAAHCFQRDSVTAQQYRFTVAAKRRRLAYRLKDTLQKASFACTPTRFASNW
ncbi:hypothetical protein OAG76_00705 [Rubripirellula sp.]|nr:hypothetical protein [Rubripirellula sp.]